MAIDFPSSPTDGQIFTDTPSGNQYIYRSAVGAWKSNGQWQLYVAAQINVSGAVTLDRNSGECQRLSVTGNVTSMAISNFGVAGVLRKLVLEVWNTGAFTLVWPAGTIWPSGFPPTITSGAGKKDVVILLTMDGGTTIYGTVVGQDYA